jgi:hypothetical protein
MVLCMYLNTNINTTQLKNCWKEEINKVIQMILS